MILEGLTSALALQVGSFFHPPAASPLSPSPLETTRNSDGSRHIDDVMKTSGNGIYVRGSARNILPVGTFTRDVVVVGGGLAGLSTALELSRRGVRVTVLSYDIERSASAVAGGMLAPQAEMLPEGPYLDLCLRSRSMYHPWVQAIETMASSISPNKVDVGLVSNRGFIAPAFEGDAVHRWLPPKYAGQVKWLNTHQLREMEPLVNDNVIGGWWYPQDMQVDVEPLMKALHDAVTASGGEILEGVGAKSFMYGMYGDRVESIALTDGRHIQPGAVVSATGAWMGELVPIKMVAIKGQAMKVRSPKSNHNKGDLSSRDDHPLHSVLFADGAYIIPKPDGSIIAGGTTEIGVWDRDNTPRGISDVASVMSKVCPRLNDFTLERMWSGLRPTTEDYLPVLGASEKCENLFMCGGFWRNGVLLPPKVSQLVADAVVGAKFGEEDSRFMREFSPDRFDGTGALISPSPYAFISSSSSSSTQKKAAAALASLPDGPTPSLPSSHSSTPKKEDRDEEIQQQLESSSSSSLETKTNLGNEQMDEPNDAAASSVESQASCSKEPLEDSVPSPPVRFTEEELQESREANRDMDSISEDFDPILDPNIEDGDRMPSWSSEAPRIARKFGAKLVPDPRGTWHPPSSEDDIFAMVVDESTGEEVFPTSGDFEASAAATAAASSTQPETLPFMLVSNASLGSAAAGVRGARPQRSAEVEELYESILRTKNSSSSSLIDRQMRSAANRKAHKKDSSSPFSWLTGLLRMRPSSTTTTITTFTKQEVEGKETVPSSQLYGYDRIKKTLQTPVGQDLNESQARRSSLEGNEDDQERFEDIAREFGDV